MRKLVVLLVLFSIGLLLIGIPAMWNVLRYRQPVVITDLKQDPTDLPGYVQLREIRIPGIEATIVSSRRGTRVFAPIRSRSGTSNDKVTIMLESDDPALLEAVTRLGGKGSLANVVKQLRVFDQKTEATGMVHRIEYDSQLQAMLSDYESQLADHAVVVREGESPSLGLASLALSVAAAMIALLGWIWGRRSATTASASAEPPLLRS